MQECSGYLEPHRLKQKAAGKSVVMVPLIIYSDDTSGNKSKKVAPFEQLECIAGRTTTHDEQSTDKHSFFILL